LSKQYRRRRTWSVEEKSMICAQTQIPDVSVAQVARRYDVNANQVFKWLKEPRFAGPSAPDEDGDAEVGPVFLPVEIIGDASEEVETSEPTSCTSCHRLEIDLAGGHRLRVIGAYDAKALAGLIRRLSA